MRLILLLIIVLSLVGCEQKPKRIRQGNEVIEYQGNDKGGVERRFTLDGKLKSVTPYKDSKPHGVKVEYHSNGNVSKEIPCTNGIVNGVVKEYYLSGSLSRESPTENGKVHGLRKMYYEDGRIKAEVPFLKGKPQVGLKEYDINGNILQEAKLLFRGRDKTVIDNTYIVELTLSQKERKVSYHFVLVDGENEYKSKLPIENGKGIYVEHVYQGGVVMRDQIFEARHITQFGNTRVIRGKYRIAVSNTW